TYAIRSERQQQTTEPAFFIARKFSREVRAQVRDRDLRSWNGPAGGIDHGTFDRASIGLRLRACRGRSKNHGQCETCECCQARDFHRSTSEREFPGWDEGALPGLSSDVNCRR